jgi:hypothetical protein
MRIKVEDKWYEALQQPIMVELTPKDKENIKTMDHECSKYAEFPSTWSEEKILEWMEASPGALIEIP